MASSKVGETIFCLYCGKAYHSALSLANHLDHQHKGWVENVLRKIGVDVPRTYPIPEYRRAIAQHFAGTDSPARLG
jgi:hypothetical protein